MRALPFSCFTLSVFDVHLSGQICMVGEGGGGAGAQGPSLLKRSGAVESVVGVVSVH